MVDLLFYDFISSVVVVDITTMAWYTDTEEERGG